MIELVVVVVVDESTRRWTTLTDQPTTNTPNTPNPPQKQIVEYHRVLGSVWTTVAKKLDHRCACA